MVPSKENEIQIKGDNAIGTMFPLCSSLWKQNMLSITFEIKRSQKREFSQKIPFYYKTQLLFILQGDC